MDYSYKLERFIDAQKDSYSAALREIKEGRKKTHWMWYIFPQISGLGISDTARFYAIGSLAEAHAFLEHQVLGPRLIAICSILLMLDTNDAREVFGQPDDMKLRSCMTLFSLVPDTDPIFLQVLKKFFGGEGDPKTLQQLAQQAS